MTQVPFEDFLDQENVKAARVQERQEKLAQVKFELERKRKLEDQKMRKKLDKVLRNQKMNMKEQLNTEIREKTNERLEKITEKRRREKYLTIVTHRQEVERLN